jgi:hypothetical protein
LAKAGTLQKLPRANELFGPILVWEHLWMNSEDDPEARIRELEQPLAEAARTSESEEARPPGRWAPPSVPPLQPPPLPYTGSQFGSSVRTTSRGRTWWIVAAVFAIGMIALPAGIILFTAHQVSRSGVTTLLPIPRMSSTSPSSAGGATPTPAGPSTSDAAVPTASIQENVIVSGINENRTIVCNQNTVTVSGISNTVTITGHCTSLSVSGVQNEVTIEAVDSIDASGFSNQITYRRGTPHIDQSGQDNDVHKG